MSNRPLVLCFLTLALTLSPTAKAAAKAEESAWVHLQQGPFSVYTQGDPSQALALIQSFAELHSALAQASAFHPDPTVNLKIVAFRSDKEFNQYRLHPGSCAFFQQTERAEYIVLGDFEGPNRDVSFHEFSHFVFAHSHVNLPLWLNEGLADFYSTFKVTDSTVTFGAPVNGRLSVLRSAEWLPLGSLFDASNTSPYYSNFDQMVLFYSESWVLAHMLVASPAYASGFPVFLNAISSGRTAAESLKVAYNKTPDQVQQDLHAYVGLHHLPTIQSTIKPESIALAASPVAPVSVAEMNLNLFDISLSNPAAQASLATRMPESAQAEESLGFASLHQGKTEDARTHFRLAVDRHSGDPNVLFYLAHLDHEAGAPATQVMPLLERALAIKPDLGDARLELALIATAEGDFAKALEAIQKVTAPRPENAYTAVYTEAYCLANLDKLSEARAAAHHAQTLAGNDRDRAEVSQLLDFIDQQSKDMVASASN